MTHDLPDLPDGVRCQWCSPITTSDPPVIAGQRCALERGHNEVHRFGPS